MLPVGDDCYMWAFLFSRRELLFSEFAIVSVFVFASFYFALFTFTFTFTFSVNFASD